LLVLSKSGTEIAGHVETAAQPGIAEARGELDATTAKDEHHWSRPHAADYSIRGALQQSTPPSLAVGRP
jgi:hypothetical protein